MHAALPLKGIPIVGAQGARGAGRLLVVHTMRPSKHRRWWKVYTFPGWGCHKNDNKIPARSNGHWTQFTSWSTKAEGQRAMWWGAGGNN